MTICILQLFVLSEITLINYNSVNTSGAADSFY